MDRNQQERMRAIHQELTGQVDSHQIDSEQVGKFLLSLSSHEKEQASGLLKKFDQESSLTLSCTLRGIKPLSCMKPYFELSPEYEAFKMLKFRLEQMTSPEIVLFETVETVNIYQGEVKTFPWILRRDAALQVIEENIDIFQKALGRTTSPEEIVAGITTDPENWSKVLDDGVLLGMLFGYGRENAFHYQEVLFLQIFSSEVPLNRVPLGYESFLNRELHDRYCVMQPGEINQRLNELKNQREGIGPQGSIPWQENYPGFMALKGSEHARNFVIQCKNAIPEIKSIYAQNAILEEFAMRALS